MVRKKEKEGGKTMIKKGEVVIWIDGNPSHYLESGVVEDLIIADVGYGEFYAILIEGLGDYFDFSEVFTREQINDLFEHPIFKKSNL